MNISSYTSTKIGQYTAICCDTSASEMSSYSKCEGMNLGTQYPYTQVYKMIGGKKL